MYLKINKLNSGIKVYSIIIILDGFCIWVVKINLWKIIRV